MPPRHGKSPKLSSSAASVERSPTLSSTSSHLLSPPSPALHSVKGRSRSRSRSSSNAHSTPLGSSLLSSTFYASSPLSHTLTSSDDEDELLPKPVWYNAFCCATGELSWYGVASICLFLSLFSLAIHMLIDSLRAKLPITIANFLGNFATFIALLAVPLTHGISGRKKHKYLNYHFWQPFVGGFKFVLLQCLGWTIWTFTLLGGVYALYIGTKKVTTGWLSAVGVGGVISQILVLVSLHFFVANVSSPPTQEETHTGKKRKTSRATQSLSQVKEEVDGEEKLQPVRSQSTPLDASIAGRSRGRLVLFLLVLSCVAALFLESSYSSKARSSIQSIPVTYSKYLLSAVLLSVPVTHYLAAQSRSHEGYVLFQPFQGGTKFVTLQALAWTLWTLAFLGAVASVYFDLETLSHATSSSISFHLSSLISSAGIGGVISQALVLLSLRFFDKRISHQVSTSSQCLRIVQRRTSLTHQPLPHSPKSKTTLDTAEQQKAILETASEVYEHVLSTTTSSNNNSNTNNAASSGIAPIGSTSEAQESKMNTHTHTAALSPSHTRRPSLQRVLSGKSLNMLTSSADTTKDSSTSFERELEEEVEVVLSKSRVPTTISKLSLTEFKQAFQLMWHRLSHIDLVETYLDVRAFCVVAVLYLTPLLGAFATFLPFFILYSYSDHELSWFITPSVLSVVMLYLSTWRNRPGLSGRKSWKLVRDSELLWSSLERYFSATIVPVGEIPADKGPYMFGFHPHGIYPMTAFWATRGPSFRKAYKNLTIDVCAASIMFYSPFLREMCLWSGGREVSGSSIRFALREQKSVILVPGGQREMRYSRADENKMVLVTRHKGFIRMALEHGVPLVPVLSLGENMSLENVYAPRVQAYTLRKLGVGFPIWPYGRWFSPLPNPTRKTVIFGRPIPCPKKEKVEAEDVDRIHKLYYDQLKELFEAHKDQAGLPSCKLEFTDD